MKDQYTVQDPTAQYPKPPFDKQQQPGPGLAQEMNPKPDHGEDTIAVPAGSRAGGRW